MLRFRFSKMNGAGNDFIVTDDSDVLRSCTPDVICAMCDRRRGIGADGIIFLSKSKIPGCSKVVMEFFNCDGSKADLCGNGLRCAAMFAYRHGLSVSPDISFITGSGDLDAHVLPDGTSVRIQLPLTEEFRYVGDVAGFNAYKGTVGVPHTVVFIKDLAGANVLVPGRKLRNHPVFAPAGTNVDFLPEKPDFSKPVDIRTYERGVEDETLACGTGIASSAVVLRKFFDAPSRIQFKCRAGDILTVDLECDGPSIRKINLTGPAAESFRGTTETLSNQQ